MELTAYQKFNAVIELVKGKLDLTDPATIQNEVLIKRAIGYVDFIAGEVVDNGIEFSPQEIEKAFKDIYTKEGDHLIPTTRLINKLKFGLGINRPTAILLIQESESKGFLESFEVNGKTLYHYKGFE